MLARSSGIIRLLLLLPGACAAGSYLSLAQALPSPVVPSAQQATKADEAVVPRLPSGIVAHIKVHGTPMATAPAIVALIEQKPGTAINREAIRRSIRRLYATRLFETIDVVAEPAEAGQIDLIFETAPSYFTGSLSIDGLPKGGPGTSEMVNSSKLELGTRYSEDRLQETLDRMRRLMADSGYYQAKITYEVDPAPAIQQMKLNFHVVAGKIAHVGHVTVTGNPEMPAEDIVSIARLYPGEQIRKNEVQRALRKLRRKFQQGKRLEAQVGIVTQYNAGLNTVDYTIDVQRGPVVDIITEGAKIPEGKLKKYVPVYQENAVDDDLLNEGRRNLRNYLQTEGYFDARVAVQETHDSNTVKIVYQIDRGPRHKLVNLKIEGNKYFSEQTIREHLSLQLASWTFPHGRFSQEIVARDISAIKDLYLANGFTRAEVVANIVDDYESDPQKIQVVFRLVEGPQVLVRVLTITGNKSFPAELLERNLYTVAGQPYSEANIATDRDTLVNFYFTQGFPEVQFEAAAKPYNGDPDGMEVTYTLTEGSRVFVDKLLVSGLLFTRQELVERQFSIHDGDPLNQAKMVASQSKLYDLGIFNEVDMAVQNPTGEIDEKNLLYQIQEAKRWTFRYGGGIEFATGNVPGSNPQGNTGVSPDVSFDVTRINFRGRDESLIFKSQLGTLIKRALLTFDEPRWFDLPRWHFSATALYDNTRDVNTFTSERLEGSLQLVYRWTRATRLLAGFSYRRDKVDPSSFPAGSLVAAAPAVRVGMPTLSYVRDTRDDPIQSTKGSYNTADFGGASGVFGSEANFGRILLRNSTYHLFAKQYVFARSTTIGAEPAYGSGSAGTVPLPENFFAGGGNSLRGFAINQAGPRDPGSGFPIGGTAMFVNNLELRMPPVALPLVGQGVSFVIFHDMGNVFDTVHDMWTSLPHWTQPNGEACRSLSSSTCDFNFMSQSIGGGVRYRTPVGPVRLDLGYNLNPASFQVRPPNVAPSVEQLRRINVFFSIGQTF